MSTCRAWIVASVAVSILGCASQQKPNNGIVSAPSTDTIANSLRELPLVEISSLVDNKNRKLLPPSVSKHNLQGALGAVYALVAKDGKNCSSSNKEDFLPLKLFLATGLPSSCRTRIFNNEVKVRSITTKAGLSGELKYLFGELSGGHEFVFDLQITEPVAAQIENPRKCIAADRDRILREPRDENTCDLFYVHEATLMMVNYRRLDDIEAATTQGYSAIVKVAGKLYSQSNSYSAESIIIADNRFSLRRYFFIGATGALQSPKRNITNKFDPPTEISEAEAQVPPQTLDLIRQLEFSPNPG